MSSASDVGWIGRLVLPKKCAEAYFPSITQPEGLPLKVLNVKGKEWIVQFRFWPNNNSRMYVLEGVTHCLQATPLRAGDIVTFSRLEPEGNLVMDFRKAATKPDQKIPQTSINDKIVLYESTRLNPQNTSSWTKFDMSGYIAKEILGAKPIVARRKSRMLGSKTKRLKTESEDVIELKLTWEEAQGLLQPPSNDVQSFVEMKRFEFEEYEDAPIIGRPTIITSDNICEKNRWTQCADCYKWPKLPISILPFRWTCSDNAWDPERSICSAAQELTTEQLERMPSPGNSACKKMKTTKRQPDRGEALEGVTLLHTLPFRPMLIQCRHLHRHQQSICAIYLAALALGASNLPAGRTLNTSRRVCVISA